MKLHEYLSGVNKTWKKEDGLKELAHCRLGVIEEIGNVAGWHRKYIAYGVPKEITGPGMKDSCGSLLYYLSKLTSLSGCEKLIEPRFEELEVKGAEDIDILGALSSMSEAGIVLTQCSFHSEAWSEEIQKLTDLLIIMITHEGWEMEDIQYISLANAGKAVTAE